MRTVKLTAAFLGLFGLAALGGTACFDIAADDILMGRACEDGTFDCFAQSTTTTTGPKCDGDPTQDGSLVRDECGVFVKPGAVDGKGTKDKPFGTFVEAAKANSGWVFACEGEYLESEGVVFGGDVAVYGGFTGCAAEWKWSADAKAKITGPADVIAVTLTGGTSLVTNVDISAADAEKDGGSSIAVLVKGGTVEIRSGKLVSGAAKAGAAGESLGADSTLDGIPGTAGAAACAAGGNHPGPPGATNTCGDGSTSVGGTGGGGFLPVTEPGGSGEAGTPSDPAFPTFGQGGLGQESNGANDPPVCTDGTSGAPGGDGAAAMAVSGVGDIGESGYTGVAGTTGEYGKPGQGGGGGGGSKGAAMVNCGSGPVDIPGASGGAGGTGGCGGKGGGGGGAGGASIVVLSLGGDITLTSVNLRPGAAGKGGVGGKGQGGGNPGGGGAFGVGTSPAKKSCSGGDGGSGGIGGAGSGGTGGHAIGVAFKGGTLKGGTVVMDKAVLGTGGDGGPGNEAPGKGTDGLACKTFDFEQGAAGCVP